MRPKAVVLLLDSSPKSWGSKEEFHKRLAGRLIDAGFVVVLVLANPIDPNLEERFRSSGLRLLYFNYTTGGKGGFFRFLSGLQAELEIRLLHIRYFDYFALLPWLAKRAGVPHVVFTEANSGSLKATGWRLALIRLRTAVTTGPIDVAIGISEFIRQRLIGVGIPARKTAVVYNGIDESVFHPNSEARACVRAKFGVSATDFVILWMAELRPMKRMDVALQALALLRSRRLQPKFMVAGDGALRGEMEQLAKALGVDDLVVWMGYQSKPQEVMPAGDVFLLPSEGEAFGFVIGEAMCCGLPVVGTRDGAIPELVLDGITGFLATAGDAQSFASALEKLVRDRDFCRDMGERSRLRALEHFTIDVAVAGTLRVYDAVWNA